ncbi:hypothetical protein RRG08_035963 [Elysia crispata]|uniref:Uncharacterized protein n=1 Tax=Elysia crispata TaxID=231223 RepID=A0AAE1ARW6_9GAST|nr:hypothetical protein RRG08_035963 [Elysia crispata]
MLIVNSSSRYFRTYELFMSAMLTPYVLCMMKVVLHKPSVVTWVSTKPPESAVGSGNSPNSPTKRLSAFLQWTSYSLRRLDSRHLKGVLNIRIPDTVQSTEYQDSRHLNGVLNIRIPDTVQSTEYQDSRHLNGVLNIRIPDTVQSIKYQDSRHLNGVLNIRIQDIYTEY